MSKPTVNGEVGFSSETLSHFAQYRLVSESIDFYKSRPLGAKSLDILNAIYENYGKPFIPYFQKPINIASPYAKQVDHLGNSALDTVDTHVPALKETGFGDIYNNASATAHYPFKLAGEGRDYVFSTYNDERSKTPEKGLLGTGKAFVSTELRIAAESLHAVADWFGPRKQQLEDEIQKLLQAGQKKSSEVKKDAEAKSQELQNGTS